MQFDSFRNILAVRLIGLLLLGIFVTDGYLMGLLPQDQQESISLFEAGDFESEEEKNEKEENEKEEFQISHAAFNQDGMEELFRDNFKYLTIRRYCHYLEIVTPPPEC